MKRTALLALLLAAAVSQADTNTLRVSLQTTRSGTEDSIDSAVRVFAKRTALLTKATRRTNWRGKTLFSLPVRVEVMKNGAPLPVRTTRADGDDIVLKFNTASGRTFPAAYRTTLETAYADAKSQLEAYFGKPLIGGTVLVSNYDADISDRSAVAGGVYIPNSGSGTREIRFPVYGNTNSAKVNFIHTLLLAYQGNTPVEFDAWQEGIVRAVTAKVTRSLALAGKLDSSSVESTLFNSYEVGGWYDWYNQPALGGRRFIAPNLLDEPLPLGGTYGGLYLLRYRMSGSAWEKVLVQYPDFGVKFNQALKADPSIANDEKALIATAQTITKSQGVEGMGFPQWWKRQQILNTVDEPGVHLHLQPTPITSGLSGNDYGVFNLEATLFSKQVDGNETLLAGTAFPIFWDPRFNSRILPGGTSQNDQIDFNLAYGSVGPNFEADSQFPGIYRINYDLSIYGVNERVYLPVGAISTPATQGNPNNLYGTVSGMTGTAAASVRVTVLGKTFDTPITNGAFGSLVDDTFFGPERSIKVQVIQGSKVLLERSVNKAQGDLELDLRIGDDGTQSVPLPAGVSAFGFALQPYRPEPASILNVSASRLLLSHFDPLRGLWSLYPDSPYLRQGFGHAVRLPSARTATTDGRLAVEPTSVALSPGWNLVVSPIASDLTANDVSVVTGTDFPLSYEEAQGTVLGRDAFFANPGAVDPASGVPETLVYSEANAFPKERAMFVRCLSADGATILFGKGLAPRSTRGVKSSDRWRVKLAASGAGVTATAYASMSRTATRRFDPREDSALPPSRGGFGISVGGNYRDTRGVSSVEEYAVRLDGLTAGKTYSVVVTQEVGLAPRLSVYDPVTGRRTMIAVSGRFSFTATGTSRTLTLRAEGVR